MSMNDLISDMLTRIRNAQRASLLTLTCPASKINEQILTVLQEEGYIKSFSKKEVRPGVSELLIVLKYKDGSPVIVYIKRVSKPGRKVYYSIDQINAEKCFNGLGIMILSTSKGVLSDRQAKELNVGGEVICNVY